MVFYNQPRKFLLHKELVGRRMMDSEARHECGLAAISLGSEKEIDLPSAAAYYLYRMLLQQQNRGQLSAGITTFDEKRELRLFTYRKLGLVNEAMSSHNLGKHNAILDRLQGNLGIGHVRYATCGTNDITYAQPFEMYHGRSWKWFSIAFNGNLANFNELKASLEEKNYQLVRKSDTELIMHNISYAMRGDERISLESVFSDLSNKFIGAYNILFLNAEGKLAAFRDPLGFHPLCYSIQDGNILIASESCAISHLGYNNIQSLNPGELLEVENNEAKITKVAESPKKAHCMFEFVYFANPSSEIEGKSVYNVRWNLGKELAKGERLELNETDYVVVAVPDTAKPAADAFARFTGLASMEGLLRNRYVGRTFIEGDAREQRVKEKYDLNKPVLEGKKVILVEDSIVRGSTIKPLVHYIKNEGKVKEVHVRVSCPPIRAPCFFGIDMSTLSEMIAVKHMSKEEIENVGFHDLEEKTIDKIRQHIGADSLRYQTLEGLGKAIGFEGGTKNLCMACVTGKYPMEFGDKLYQISMKNHQKGEKGRTFELEVKS